MLNILLQKTLEKMALHFTENKSNQGTSVAKTPFLIDNILHQSASPPKNGIKQNSGGSNNNNNNNSNVNNNNINSIRESPASSVSEKNLRIDGPSVVDDDYRKMLQSER